MNRTKIEWCDYTWNPVTGCWGPGGSYDKPTWCSYCYARQLAQRFDNNGFTPTFHQKRLNQPKLVYKPARIFVCSMADLFGDWVPEEWIAEVQQVSHDCPQHTFMFLTKNPKRYQEFNPWPENCWVGATVTNQQDFTDRIPGLLKAQALVRFISAEPLTGAIALEKCWGLSFERMGSAILSGHPLLRRIQWLIIGALTGPRSTIYRPDGKWVWSLWEQAREAGVPVFMKDSLKPIMGTLVREYPHVSLQ